VPRHFEDIVFETGDRFAVVQQAAIEIGDFFQGGSSLPQIMG
jgi:hypothetical protein